MRPGTNVCLVFLSILDTHPSLPPDTTLPETVGVGSGRGTRGVRGGWKGIRRVRILTTGDPQFLSRPVPDSLWGIRKIGYGS